MYRHKGVKDLVIRRNVTVAIVCLAAFLSSVFVCFIIRMAVLGMAFWSNILQSKIKTRCPLGHPLCGRLYKSYQQAYEFVCIVVADIEKSRLKQQAFRGQKMPRLKLYRQP